MVRVDPDPARDLAGFGARVRLQVGDHFAAACSARGAFTPGGVTGAGVARVLSLSPFAAGTAATAAVLAEADASSPAGACVPALSAFRSLQVTQRPFELRFLFAERGDVFFDQSLGLVGLGHVVMVLSGTSEDRGVGPAYGASKRGLKVGRSQLPRTLIGYMHRMLRRLLPLLLGALLLIAPGSATAEPISPRDYLRAEMVTGASGWAQTNQGIYWTDDGGGSWRNITPEAAGHRVSPKAVYFADPEHGWAAAEEGDEPHPRAALFATSDGGRSWKRTPIRLPVRYAQVGDASFAEVGAHHIVALVRVSHDTSLSVGYLYVSNDGGRHWQRLPEQPPHAGQISFTSARDGWLAEEGPDPALYRTTDGGRSWSEVDLPRAPWLIEARADYLAPRFEADGHGILAATYDNFEKPAYTFLYETSDFGRHWHLATKAKLIVEGDPAVYAYRGGEALFTGLDESPDLGLLAVDGETSTVAGSGLPAERSPWLSFSNTEDGFARIEGEDCDVTAKRAKCTEVNGLYFSSDGGESWVPTTRP